MFNGAVVGVFLTDQQWEDVFQFLSFRIVVVTGRLTVIVNFCLPVSAHVF